MDTLLAWLSQYSAPVVTLLALSAAGIYVLKNVMESTISAQFNKHTRQIELLLERRARFEEKVLLDQYELVKALQAEIIDVAADLNRHHSGIPVDGLFNANDIPRLTEIFQRLAANRYLLRDEFYDTLYEQANLLLALANAKGSSERGTLGHEYMRLQDEFHRAMLDVFGMDRISW
jgi:hypothetical protein